MKMKYFCDLHFELSEKAHVVHTSMCALLTKLLITHPLSLKYFSDDVESPTEDQE